MKTVTTKKLNELKQDATQLKQAVINDILEQDNDYRQGYIEDVLNHGCVSGTVSGLIYYKDTVAFYDKHTEDIWDLLHETQQSLGDKTILETISHLNGAENVGSDDQLKNLLAWFGYEETIGTIAEDLGLEL